MLPRPLAPRVGVATLWLAACLAAPWPAALSPLVGPFAASVAHAQPAPGVRTILPVPPAAVDGETEVVVHALLFADDGTPVVGAKLKAVSSSGRSSDVEDLGGGLYRVAVTPGVVVKPSTVTVTLKGRADVVGAVDLSRTFDVVPGGGGRVQVTTNLTQLTLGQDGQATVSFVFPTGGAAGAAPSANDVLVRASSGEVTAVTPMGNGRFTARYEPPAVNYPHLAILTAVDRRDPQRVFGTAVVRLLGKVDYPVTAPSGANVVLRVGGREFGPVSVGASGQASVPIVVPPGISAASQVTANGGDVQETMIDLRVPSTQRLALFAVPPTLPSDDAVQLPVRVAVYKADGSPDPAAEGLVLAVTAGTVTTPTHVGDGVYEAMFTPPDGRVEVTATLQATLGNAEQSDAVELRLTPAMPASISLTTDPEQLAAGSSVLDVFASLRDAEGNGLDGRDLDLRAIGATGRGKVVDLGGGDYRQGLDAPGPGSVRVQAIARAARSDNALARVLIVPMSNEVGPDEDALFAVISADAFGYPVPSVDVSLSAPDGGEVAPTVSTDANGLAVVSVAPGGASPVRTLRGEAGGIAGVGAAVVGGSGLALLPPSGDAATRQALGMWRGAVATRLVPRDGASGVVAGPSGPPAAVEVQAAPPSIAPGGSTTVTVTVRDAAGAPVEGATVEVFATAGAVPGPVTSLGRGKYQATVTAPAGLAQDVKINVVANDGAAVAVFQLPLGTATGLWGAATAPPAEPAPAPAADDPTPATDKPARERPFLRVRASGLFSGYSYEQAPSDNPGPLFPRSLGWGYDRGAGAVPFGLDTSVRLIVPKLPYLGVQGGFRWSRYAVESPEFDAVINDNVYLARVALVGRYPFEIGREELSIGARVGFRWDDFISFRGCTDPGCDVTYEPVGLPGLDVGGEIGAEFWKMYALVGVTGGFAYGTIPYALNLDVNLGVNITRWFLVDVGLGYTNRNAEVEGADSGEIRGTLRDRQVLGTVGIGFGW